MVNYCLLPWKNKNRYPSTWFSRSKLTKLWIVGTKAGNAIKMLVRCVCGHKNKNIRIGTEGRVIFLW